MERIMELSACALAEKLRAKELSAQQATEAYLSRIEEKNKDWNLYLTLCADQALAKAKQIDARRAKGEELPFLAGVPFGLKDNICTKGVRTTCASKMLADFVPGYQATVVDKLEEAGAVLLGKLNMDEFAMGSNNETSAFGPAKNPLDESRVPGGSSGGSAAAVAGKLAAFTLGTDTGGSIRQPAAFCGVVGMKPSYGRVSRYGAVAFASSLDQIGPLGHSVADCAAVLNAIGGYDAADSTSVPKEMLDFTQALGGDVKGMRIALPTDFLAEGMDEGVQKQWQQAAERFRALGAQVEEVAMPMLKNALPAYYVISGAEASSNLARFDGIHYGSQAKQYDDLDSLYENTRNENFGAEVKRRILLGTFVLSAGYYDAYYKKAMQVRTLVMREFARVFETYDLVLSPTTPGTAYPLGTKASPMQLYLGDIFTVPANIAGLPAISLPCGQTEEGLPVGLQLMGRAFDEETLLRAAHALEQSMGGQSA